MDVDMLRHRMFVALFLFSIWASLSTMVVYWRFEIHSTFQRHKKRWIVALFLFSIWASLSTVVVYWRFEIHSTFQRAIYVGIRPPKDLKPVHTNYAFDTNKSSTVVWQDFGTARNQQFFVFSVIASKSKRGQEWDHVVVNGWETPAAVNQSYRCCYYYDNGREMSTMSFNKQTFKPRGIVIEARQVMCKFVRMPNIPRWSLLPSKMTIVPYRDQCPSHEVGHVITYPKLEKQGVFAVCGKIAYGEKNAKHLIEWIEYQRYFGADKIVLYPYQDLNKDALHVLQFYVMNDVIEIVPLPYVPMIFESPRYFGVMNNPDMYNDEQVTLFDAQSRLWGYKYLAVYDTDEFPTMNKRLAGTFHELMEFLTSRYTLAGTFTMRCHFHSLSTNQTTSSGSNNDVTDDLMIARYSRRSDTITDRPKFIHITDRVVPRSVRIHEGFPIEPYRRYILHDSEVVLKHFRDCPTRWNGPPGTKVDEAKRCSGGTRDDTMKPIADAIRPNVRKVIEMLDL